MPRKALDSFKCNSAYWATVIPEEWIDMINSVALRLKDLSSEAVYHELVLKQNETLIFTNTNHIFSESQWDVVSRCYLDLLCFILS
jgi:hypothetical protein